MAAEDVLNSPTVRDGWSAVHEAGVRKKAGRVMYELASTMVNPVLRMCVLSICSPDVSSLPCFLGRICISSRMERMLAC